ncbi:MAG: PAS domain S-box protein [candidate division Zixibacteria bacterium]|nr:PAS domain S-box protein [candidate division Zixibacteria bacterium]
MAICIPVLYITFSLEIAEYIHRFHFSNEAWDTHELAVAFMVLVAGMLVFSFRRWKEFRREVGERRLTQAALVESREKFRPLVETTCDWIWEVDQNGVYTYCSPQVADILGYSPDEILGKTPFQLMPDEEARRVAGIFGQLVANKEPIRMLENTNLRKNGTAVVLETNGMPVYEQSGEFRGYRGVDRDITDRKLAEIGLQQAHDVLEARVQERTAELKSLNQELVTRVQALDEFTYFASHDLQEPLRKIIAFGGLLRDDLGDNLPPRVCEDVNFMIDAADRMQVLVNSLLELSRLGRKAYKFERISLRHCVDCALDSLSVLLHEKKVQFVFDDLPEVWGDETALIGLFQNLIGNALKFSSGVSPVIHVTCEEVDGATVYGVRDNGIGLDPKYADQIFQAFKRLHGQQEYKGTGIGLAICRKIVELHGGTIWVNSEFQKGAHFRFTLSERPLREEDSTCETSRENLRSSCSQKTT